MIIVYHIYITFVENVAGSRGNNAALHVHSASLILERGIFASVQVYFSV